MMKEREKYDPNTPAYTNAILEDIESKFEAVLEATQPIPQMQKQIKHILTWEDDVKLIPAIFEEVGKLRQELNELKIAMKVLGRDDKRLDSFERRLTAVEQRVT